MTEVHPDPSDSSGRRSTKTTRRQPLDDGIHWILLRHDVSHDGRETPETGARPLPRVDERTV